MTNRSNGERRITPSSSVNDLSTERTRTLTSFNEPRHQHQQQHPFVLARADQSAPRSQLTAAQPIRASPATDWLAGRKSHELSLDRLVEINARQLTGGRENAVSGSGSGTRSSSTVRRPPPTANFVASSSALYGRAKALPVTNNVAKPFSTGKNY